MPYMGRDMQFLKNVSPRRALADFKAVLIKPQEHRGWFILGSLAAMAIIFSAFFSQSGYRAPLPTPEITYFENWAADRPDDVIRAEQRADYIAKLERELAAQEAAEKEREAYMAVGRVFGMDVEEIARDADEKRAEQAQR